MIFAMADIHGYADVFEKRIKQIEEYLEKGHKLILLGDYIERDRLVIKVCIWHILFRRSMERIE